MARMKKRDVCNYLDQEWVPDFDFCIRTIRRLMESPHLDIEFLTDEDSEDLLIMLDDCRQKVLSQSQAYSK